MGYEDTDTDRGSYLCRSDDWFLAAGCMEDVLMTQDERSLRAALTIVFGNEWVDLSAPDKALIVRDCTEDGGVSDLGVYRSSIGAGNLAKYALTQRIRFKRAK